MSIIPIITKKFRQGALLNPLAFSVYENEKYVGKINEPNASYFTVLTNDDVFTVHDSGEIEFKNAPDYESSIFYNFIVLSNLNKRYSINVSILNNEVTHDGYVIATDDDSDRTGFVLAADYTEVAEAGYGITKYIPITADMQLRYTGNFDLSTQYYSIAHIFDENFSLLGQATLDRISGNTIIDLVYDFPTAKYARFCYKIGTALSVITKNIVEYRATSKIPVVSASHYLNNTDLTEVGFYAFDGSYDGASNYRHTGYKTVKAGTRYRFNGYIVGVASICVFDCNYRFLQSYLITENTVTAVLSGTFVTHIESAYIIVSSISACIGDYTRKFFVDELIREENYLYRTAMQGIKASGNFRLANGIDFIEVSGVNTWEENIELLGDVSKLLNNDYAISTAQIPTDISPDFSIVTLVDGVDTLTFRKAGKNGIWANYFQKLYRSTDGGATFSLIDTLDKYAGASIEGVNEDDNGNLYVSYRSNPDNWATQPEEELIRYDRNGEVWTRNNTPVITIPHQGGATDYRTIEHKWGFTSYDNIVVVNDYGTQGIAGHLWISTDSGETFTEILDIYDAPHTSYISNGHIHGSCFDHYWNRIWVTTGDGVNNTWIMYSDDYGINWSRVKVPFRSTILNQSFAYVQLLKCLAQENCVLFLADSQFAGVWRYNRHLKTETPIFEWVADITDHALNQMATEGTFTGIALYRHNSNNPIVAVSSWHDITKAAAGVLGNVSISYDGYNWFVIYEDTINEVTGRGYIGSGSLSWSDGNYIYVRAEGTSLIKIEIPQL